MKKITGLTAFIPSILTILAAILFWTGPAQAQRIEGFADMHTHPMSHDAFGGMIMFGAPDEGSLMLKGQRYRGFDFFGDPKNCWGNGIPGSVDQALGNDNALHGGPGVDNQCGDVIRTAIIDKVEKKYIYEFPNLGLLGPLTNVNDHPHAGYPAFTHWPHWSSVTHQQMWWQWIKRSFDGGQRVMVALAVNNKILAQAANATQFADDKSSVELQLAQITSFVERHLDFMAVARTPEDLRRIVQSNRMAIILGVETDDFGNLAVRANFGGEEITQSKVDLEIRRLHDLGVRYILPIHFSNTVLGGYAIKDPLFALSSKGYTNSFAVPIQTCSEGIHFKLGPEPFDDPQRILLRTRGLGPIIDTQPSYTAPSDGCGHKNELGLTPIGENSIQTMMNLGMMIDIDHMSRKATDRTLEIAKDRNYPINSGHNGPLPSDCITGRPSDRQNCTENQRTPEQYANIRSLGGMIGLGHGGKATTFVGVYRNVLEMMGNRPVAIGTDANGLEALPAPDPEAPVQYDSSFPMYRFGTKNWNFNEVGFAHYGMFPDYIKSWQSSANPAKRMSGREMDAFMSSAEGFARMWEKSALRAVGAPQTDNLSETTRWCGGAVTPAFPLPARPTTLYSGDFNGDGAADLLCQEPNRLSIDYADSRGSLASTPDWSLDSRWCIDDVNAKLNLGDFNGDGRTDLLCRTASRWWIDYADAQGRFEREDWTKDSTWCSRTDAALNLGDFNGDGRTDLLCQEKSVQFSGRSQFSIDYADAQGQFGETDWTQRNLSPWLQCPKQGNCVMAAPPTNWNVASSWCGAGGKMSLGDFNGDGRTDWLCRESDRLAIDYADSQGRFAGTDWSRASTWCSHTNASMNLGDFNGDGRTDLLCQDPNRLWIDYADNRGSFSGTTDWYLDTRRFSTLFSLHKLGDFNGDGRTDLLLRDTSRLQIDYADADGHFES